MFKRFKFSKKILLILFSILILAILVPTTTRALVKPNLFTGSSSVTWDDNGTQLKSTDVGNLYIPSDIKNGTFITYDPTGLDPNGCVRNSDGVLIRKTTSDNNPEFVGFYRFSANNDAIKQSQWKYGVASVEWTSDDGNSKDYNCEYGYLYTLATTEPKNVLIDGDVYSLGNIVGYQNGKTYLGFNGNYLVQSKNQIIEVKENDVKKISNYPILGGSSSNIERLESFEAELRKLIGEHHHDITNDGSLTLNSGPRENSNQTPTNSDVIGGASYIAEKPQGDILYYHGNRQGNSTLTIGSDSAPITIQKGAKQIIVANDDIVIQGKISGLTGSLAFVSLNGNITIDGQNTDVNQVDAALISLKHTGSSNNNPKNLVYTGKITIDHNKNGVLANDNSNYTKLEINGLIVGGDIKFNRDPSNFPASEDFSVGTHLIYNKNIEKLPGFVKLINPSVGDVAP